MAVQPLTRPLACVCDDPAAVVAEQLARLLNACQQAHIAVSGGSTPRALFECLASRYASQIDWSPVSIYQVDERCVPPDHPQSNWRMLHESLLNHINHGPAYRMEAERDGSALDYETIIRQTVPPGPDSIPQFTLILLGMGPDGHTASLFPDTPALHETRSLITPNSAPIPDSPRRITMTYPLLMAAARRWFLVRGSDKARPIAQAFQNQLPAGLVQPALWFLDPPAAALLPADAISPITTLPI